MNNYYYALLLIYHCRTVESTNWDTQEQARLAKALAACPIKEKDARELQAKLYWQLVDHYIKWHEYSEQERRKWA